ncbi:hypothetical protein MLD38_036986 [Melastoma candidum]|uniref:Uncharacterized protein n=1 Tax=Melastoma candidum TaxID=119954 RepID=A0ACB9LLS9_9MYRT|nr:hypothetical protein MLD38_036986 [Melastoma candidum]
MGLVEKWEWGNGCGRRRCGRLLWRLRAAVKAVAGGCRDVSVKRQGMQQLRKKQQLCSRKFQYDPWSYALNFDDGCKNFGGKVGLGDAAVSDGEVGHGGGDAVLVYVVWVKTK